MAILKYKKADGSWGEVGAAIPEGVTSVNGQIGDVALTASDVGALPNTTAIPSVEGFATESYVDSAVSSLASTSTQFNVTLSASSWSSGQYTVSNSAITSTSVVELLPSSSITKEQYEALAGAMIIGGEQATGSIKLKALGDVPTVNIPVTFIVRGDM